MDRKLRMGMVGGGMGAFIGEVHRKAARMDGGIEIVAGAFQTDPSKSAAMGRRLCIDPARAYGNHAQMIERELKRDDRIDFVTVATPNQWHFPISRDFLRAGFHVMCEKPMTLTLDEARELEKIVRETGRVFGLFHNYTGYPMVKLARDLVRQGDLGRILKIVVRYPQGWLIKPIEREGQRQASWRMDPKQSGAAGCMGDIGTHAENLARYITGLEIEEICADLTSFVPGRPLDDDGNCLVRYQQGAKGVLYSSQVSIGEENDLAICVYGEKQSLEWHQEKPDRLQVKVIDGPVQVWRRGNDYVGRKSAAAKRATRIPPGHPEGFIEAFANIYVNFADTIRAAVDGRKPTALELDFPGVKDGVSGMAFVEAVVRSAKLGATWVKLPKV